jgi:hypothetical protein
MQQHHVSKSEFKAKALEFFRQIEMSGKGLIVTDHGKPTIEIRPFRDPHHDPFEALRGSVLHYENPTDPIAEDDWQALT